MPCCVGIKLGLILTFNVFPVVVVLSADEEIYADSSFGKLKGLVDRNVEFNQERKSGITFLGVPFAKPPTGQRRFARPEPEMPIQSQYNATFYRPHCPQSEKANPYIKHFNTSEDCLYLNIFIPGESINVNNQYPVMIWIYGGLFAHGGADIYSGDILSSFNDVIVVTFNYRVNIFGFLDDGSGEFANNGLFDQKLAINWVHSHIQSFGGNPNAITLFGESAGGVSVIYQTFHDANKGRIKRVIAQSGSPLASFAFHSSPRATFYEFSKRLDCEQVTSLETLDCLRSKSSSEIVSKLKMFDPFLPSVDGEFLVDDPKIFLTENSTKSRDIMRSFSRVDFLTGVNNKDGGSLVINYWSRFGKPIEAGISRTIFESVGAPLILRLVFGNPNSVLMRATVYQYSEWSDPTNMQKIRDKFVDLATDLFFLVPAVRIVDKHSDSTENKSTYLYQFSQKPWMMEQPKWLDGALHAWEIPYVFGLTESLKIAAGIHPEAKLTIPDEDSSLSMSMMKYWTNFARTGNPNSADLDAKNLTAWPKYDASSQSYIDFTINMTSSTVKRHLEATRVKFWTDVAPFLTSQCPKEGRAPCERSVDSSYKLENGSIRSLLSSSTLLMFASMAVIIITI